MSYRIFASRGRYKVNGIRQNHKGSIAKKSIQCFEYRNDGKSNCLTTVLKDNLLEVIMDCIEVGKAESIKGHDIIRRVYSVDGKCPAVTSNTGGNQTKKIGKDGKVWRELTPVEYERLQTVDDNYTEGVSKSQRYKMIGNGWTVDVIKHILKGMDKMNNINVLSLFDGMSCGQLALQRAGIKVKNYYASEIDKYAIKVTMKNFSNTIQVGDITKLKGSNFPHIHLLMGGSPCQGFSFAGKQLNFNDPRSALFFEYVRLLKEVKPDYFLLENVRMKQEYQDVINEALGVKPVMINSALVSAQNRVRLYWSNIPGITQPEDKGIMLKDIIEHDTI